jgi:diacylglycerol kinase family enzyme
MRLVENFQAAKFDLAGEPGTAFELDGEWVGQLPATFSVEREQLRVVVP